MDRKVRALGYRRDPGETLHGFAERIGSHVGCVSRTDPSSAVVRGTHPTSGLAAWYLEYAGLRYARVLDPARIEQLQRLARSRTTP